MYCLITLMFVSLSTGCASKYGPRLTEAKYYHHCYKPIKILRDAENRVGRCIICISRYEPISIDSVIPIYCDSFICTVKGGIAGLSRITIANEIAKIQQIDDKNKRMSAYLKDIEESINDIDLQSASAIAALECYDQQFKILLSSIKNKNIRREKAQVKFNEIQSCTKESIAILGILESNAHEIEKQYRAALAREERYLQKSSMKFREIEVKKILSALRKTQKYCDFLQANTKKISRHKKAAEQLLLEQQAELNISLAEI